MIERFSDRYGYQPPAAEISVREDAPVGLRDAVPLIASSVGISWSVMRQTICEVLLEQPNPDNQYDPDLQHEVNCLLGEARWHKVYDIAEALYDVAKASSGNDYPAGEEFEHRLNNFFVENGIGWELCKGKITFRGSEAFEKSTHEVPDRLDESGFHIAAKEMREALKDISRRPDPDITGAIQHAAAALETTACEVTGQPNHTFGKLKSKLNLPKPLDQAVNQLWGYASQHGRHPRERQTVNLADAELIVTVAGALCAFIAQRRP